MNILFRDSKWFLYEHKGDHWIQSKEPMASKIRTYLHHSRPEMMRVRSIQSRNQKCIVFRTGYSKLISFRTTWDTESELSNTKEWLLYLYLDFCLDCCKAIHPDTVWFDEKRNMIHSDWELGKAPSVTSESILVQSLLDQLNNTLGIHTSTVPYDSAPWSLYHFLQCCSDTCSRSIT